MGAQLGPDLRFPWTTMRRDLKSDWKLNLDWKQTILVAALGTVRCINIRRMDNVKMTVMSAYILLEWMMATPLIMCKNGTNKDVLSHILFIPENSMTVATNFCAIITIGMHQIKIAQNSTLLNITVPVEIRMTWANAAAKRIYSHAAADRSMIMMVAFCNLSVMVIDIKGN